jgi:uncharacterized membrane protein YccC
MAQHPQIIPGSRRKLAGIIERRRVDLATITLHHAADIKPILFRSRQLRHFRNRGQRLNCAAAGHRSRTAERRDLGLRGVNTVVGGALALLAYWLWPTWERTRVSERIAEMLNAYGNYTHALSHWNSTDKFRMQELEHAHRDARSARANLEASIDRLSSEPGTRREQLASLSAVLASSHRLVHVIMALDTMFSQQPPLLTPRPRKILCPRANSALARFDAINIEADRITNSVNTLAEQIMQWTRTPEFAALHKLTLESGTGKADMQPAS